MKRTIVLCMMAVIIMASCTSRSGSRAIKPITMNCYVITEYGEHDSVLSVMYVKAVDQYDAERTYRQKYYDPKGLLTSYGIRSFMFLKDSVR